MAWAKTVVHAAAIAPAAWLGWQIYEVWRTGSDALGADPVAEIEHRTGLWALRFLTPEERESVRTMLDPAAVKARLAELGSGPQPHDDPAPGRGAAPEAFEQAIRDSDRL